MVMDDNWYYCCDKVMMYNNTELLCYSPETNVIVYVNLTQVFKKSLIQVKEHMAWSQYSWFYGTG